jgi:hypothetical protein
MLPREIQTENWPDSAKYDLPVRPIGAFRFIGLLPMLFAVVFAALPSRLGWGVLQRALRHDAAIGEWIPVVFFVVFLVLAMIPFCLGLFILAGRVRLVATKERLVITQIAGPLRWSRKLPVGNIEQLRVGKANAGSQISPPPAGLGKLGALVAVMTYGPQRIVALGYPADWLSALADELSAAMQRRGTVVPVQEVSMSLASGVAPQEQESLTQPPNSNARLAATVTGIELTVPSRGLFKDSSGLLLFGIFWCMLLFAITLGNVLGHTSSNRHDSLGTAGTVFLFLLFWTIGLSLLAFGIHLGTRCWNIQADKSNFRVARRSALRAREWQWSAGDIETVQVANSSVEVNHRPLPELQIFSRGGKKTSLLVGRETAELQWIATVLRRALGLRL